MFVIAGVSGNTGRVVAETLLAQQQPVRVIVRDAAKGAAWQARGAEVAIAELDDVAALTTALTGATGAYMLLPPLWGSANVRADSAKRVAGYAKAFDASGVKHVVFLSSVASQHRDGTGPITTTYDAEHALAAAKPDITFLRCAYFMENLGSSLFALGAGKYPTFLTADRAQPMVATHDIGVTAAKLLVEGGRGKRVVDLEGPRAYTQHDIGAELAKITGKPVEVQQGPEDAMIGALTGGGMSPAWARLFQELTHGMNTGHVAFEAGHEHLKGTTPVDVVLRQLVAAGGKGH